MYEPGEVKWGTITDTAGWGSEGEHPGYPEVTGAYLPHSCSEWVIGGPEQIRAMIADLQRLLDAGEPPAHHLDCKPPESGLIPPCREDCPHKLWRKKWQRTS